MNHKQVIELAKIVGFKVAKFTGGPKAGKESVFDSGDVDVLYNLKCFADLVAEAEREACSKTRAPSPRRLSPIGSGALLNEQQYCFDKGWREGAAAVRKAILARSTK